MSQTKDSWQWTEAETRLLLSTTLDFKASQAQAAMEWEANRKKYALICAALLAAYPENGGKEYPHKAKISTKSVAAKLKAVRSKFRDAVNSGKKSGHGRVVFLFYDLCSDIWSGTPGCERSEYGHETATVNAAVDGEDSEASSAENEAVPGPSSSQQSPAAYAQRRSKLQVSCLHK